MQFLKEKSTRLVLPIANLSNVTNSSFRDLYIFTRCFISVTSGVLYPRLLSIFRFCITVFIDSSFDSIIIIIAIVVVYDRRLHDGLTILSIKR